ncbi:hypothetical protein VZG28_02595 [Synechococcus elongatus IITB4]|uniref:hypothetical protein n=1 Tax=Synechococcus elongatus TaxID=32046 RepID=UPI0030CFE173
MQANLFLRAVQTAEIERHGQTLSVMAQDLQMARCFWQRRQQLCAGLGCQVLEIYVGDRLVASSHHESSVDL